MLSSDQCDDTLQYSAVVELHANKCVRLRRQDRCCLKATKVLVEYVYSLLERVKGGTQVLEKNTDPNGRSSVNTFQEN